MKNIQEAEGIILFTRNYREKDKLVKIFTESYGKKMFFVKNANRKNSDILSAIQPFTCATYIMDLRGEGLSFLNSSKDVSSFKTMQTDITVSAYGTYLCNLADVAIEDNVYDPALYGFLKKALQLLDEHYDPEIITNIFEVQLLNRFGIKIDWSKCAICGEQQGKFDYSSEYQGIICDKHFQPGVKRFNLDAKAIHFLRLFSHIQLSQINQINLKQDTKDSIRFALDILYDEYVGVHLKSKKFIDNMKSWEKMLKKED